MNKFAIAALMLNASAKQVQTATSAAELFSGMMKSVGIENVEGKLKCIADLKTIYGDVEVAVDDFKKKDVQDIIAGLKELQTVWGLLPQAKTDCLSSSDVKKMTLIADAFKKPFNFEYAKSKLLVNNADIQADVEGLVENFEAGKFEEAGALIGSISQKTMKGAELQKVAEMTQGLIQAFGGKIDIEALLICIYEEDEAALALYSAVEIIEEAITDKDIMEGVVGAIFVVAAYQQALQGLPACKAVKPSDWQTAQWTQSMDILDHPQMYMDRIRKDIAKNEGPLMADMLAAVEAFKAGEFVNFGEKIGDMIKIATAPVEEKPTLTKLQYAESLQGMMIPFGAKIDVEALLICIYEEDQAALILYEAVDIFKQAIADKEIMEGVMGAFMVLAAYQQALQGMPACKAVAPSLDVKRFESALDIISHPKKNLKLIEADIKKHETEIMDSLTLAISAFESENYLVFGNTLGAIMKAITEPVPAVKITKNEFAETIQGMIEPFGAKIDIYALLICIYEEDEAALALDAAVQIIEEAITDKSVMEGVFGAIFVFAAYQQALQGLPACKAIKPSEWNSQGFISALEILSHPRENMKIIKDKIVANEAQIMADLETAVSAFRSGDYNMFGKQLGNVLEFTQQQSADGSTLFLY